MLRRVNYKESQKILLNFDLSKTKKLAKGLKSSNNRVGFSAVGLKEHGLLFSGFVPFKTSKKNTQLKLILASNFFVGRSLTNFDLVNSEVLGKTTWRANGLKQFKFASVREFGDVLSSSVRF